MSAGRPRTQPAQCTVDGCDAPGYCKALCKKHYNRVWRTGDLHSAEPAARFEAHVDKSGDCWKWTGPLSDGGYGKFSCGQVKRRAHRVAYEMYVGPIPDGMHVLHRCDNPPCVNPTHLFLGTHLDNMRDMEAKGRARWIQDNLRRHA